MKITPKNITNIVADITPLKTFKLNKKGRDFIVGDIHGKFSFLMQLLDFVKFDFTADRLFSTGDLIDRGSENEDCLRLLTNPWFNATLGNHELFAILAFHRQIDYDLWEQNGGRWATRYFQQLVNATFDPAAKFSQDSAEFWYELFPLILDLPMMMTVRLRGWKKFHVVHAELDPLKFNLTDKNLSSSNFIRNAWSNEDTVEALGSFDGAWRRNIFDGNHRDIEKLNLSLSTVYSGHTIQYNNPKRYGPFVCLDTGSFLGTTKKTYGISIVEAETGRCFMKNEFGIVETMITELR